LLLEVQSEGQSPRERTRRRVCKMLGSFPQSLLALNNRVLLTRYRPHTDRPGCGQGLKSSAVMFAPMRGDLFFRGFDVGAQVLALVFQIEEGS